MIIAPDSDIILLQTPFEIDNINQLTFSNKQAQFNYFNSLPKLELIDATYQRKDGVVRYGGKFDDLLTYNYCMYRNNSYSDKWFYAYIRNITYINDNMTSIELETDVFQTWQFDIVYRRSFVEREHVSDDTIGLHTIPEGLETGEYIANTYKLYDIFKYDEFVNVMSASEFIETTTRTYTRGGKIPNGLYYFAFENPLDLAKYIDAYASRGKLEAIQSVFVFPKSYFKNFSSSSISGLIGSISTEYDVTKSEIFEIQKFNRVSINYTPKNNKLYCYPYRFMQVSNNNGEVVNYHYELFDITNSQSTYMRFKIGGNMMAGGSIRCVPLNYLGTEYNDNGLGMGKFPIGNFSGDIYTNWLTQNGVNIATNAISEGLNLSGGVARTFSGDSVGGGFQIANSLTSVANSLGEIYKRQLVPYNINGNINCGDANFSLYDNAIVFKHMTIRDEYLKIIDSYFDMYGYKVNEVKIPNITSRPNWNYVKMIGCNIIGNIPQQDLQTLKTIFNNGVTLWHNPSTFLDYSQNNK